MKKVMVSWLIFSLLLWGSVFSGPRAEAAESSTTSVQNIFIDTLYGMATGLLLATALTAARGEGHGSEWGGNLGAGAAVGGLLGAGYGVFLEYDSGLTGMTENRISFHVPTITLSPGCNNGDIAVHADVFRIRF